MTAPAEKIFLSVPEAAELTGLSPNVIRRLAHEQIIPSRRIGTRLMIPRLRLEEWGNAGSPGYEVLARSRETATT